jgi:hypothetical protein
LQPLEHGYSGGDHFFADTVTWYNGDLVFTHGLFPSKLPPANGQQKFSPQPPPEITIAYEKHELAGFT